MFIGKNVYKRFCRKFCPVFGPIFDYGVIFHPLNINFEFFTPKRHTFVCDCIVWATTHKNPPRGLTCRWVSEKRHIPIYKNFAYISPICREAPHRRICMKFNTGRPLTDIFNCAKFCTNRIMGIDSVGRKFWHSRRKEMSPLTQGLKYRSACDSVAMSSCCRAVNSAPRLKLLIRSKR